MTLGLLSIARPHNCLGAALATFVGGRLAGASAGQWDGPILRAALVVALTVAASNIANDCLDAELDRTAKPRRPIPAGDVSPRRAGLLATVASLVAFVIAATLGWWPGLIAGAAIILGIAYSFWLKSTVLIGNAVVGLLAGAALVYGGLVVAGVSAQVVVGGVLVFLFVFAREVLKTVADCSGDARAGVVTVATRRGPTFALRLFTSLAVLFVVVAIAAWFAGIASSRYLWTMLGLVVLPTLGVLTWLHARPTSATIHASLRTLKLVWFSGLCAVALMR